MNIVVAYNESPDAHAAAAWAAEIAGHMGAEVHLVAAIAPPAFPALGGHKAVQEAMEEAEKGVRAGAEAAAADLRKKGVKVVVHVERWLVVESVLDAAKKTKAGLIIVGRRGSTRATQLLIGTVSSEIVRLAPTSVLVARSDGAPSATGTIAVAVDGSEHSVTAIKVARQSFPDARLVLVHVAGEGERGADAIVHRSADHAGVARESVDFRVRHGDPATCLLDEVTHGHHRAIVLGPRGLGGLAGLLLGSVSEKVLQLAPVPVLIAR